MASAPQSTHLFYEYSRAVLQFRLGRGHPAADAETAPADVDVAAARAVRMLEQTGRSRLLLLSLGDGRLARRLAAPDVLPPDVEFTVCDADPEHVRAIVVSESSGNASRIVPEWAHPFGNKQLLVDASPQALFLLLALHGYGPDTAVIMQNQSAPPSPGLQDVRRLLASSSRHDIPSDPASSPPTIASILHPDEPGLDAFFAQAPDWTRQWIVVWDAPDVPDVARRMAREHCPVPVTHLARELAGDFSAQRNACLSAVPAGHVLFLDGDERLDPESWALIPRLAAMDVAGWRLPRRTLYPDTRHCKIGYGLWPDLQLRLFRTGPGVRFERPVHERVAGIEGFIGIAPATSILHHSRLLKTPDRLARKLQTFDNAAQGGVNHRLAGDYPTCECAVLDAAEASWHSASLVLSADHA